MANVLDILIRVTGSGQARAEVGRVQQALSSLRGVAAQLGIAFGAAGIAGGMAAFSKEAFIMASRAERLGRATDNLARSLGASGDAMVRAITEASKNTISSAQAMEIANKAMLLDVVKNQEEMSDLARIAIVLGQAMGKNAADSVDDLTMALGRQSPLLLDNLGIKMNLTEAELRYAASLGKTVEQLTDAEKKQAFLNAAWEKARQKAEELGGEVTLDTLAQLERLTAAWADFQTEFGEFLIGSGVIETITNLVLELKEGAIAWQGVFERGGQETQKAQTLAIGATIAAYTPPALLAGLILGMSPEEMASNLAQAAQEIGLVSLNAEALQQEMQQAAEAENQQAAATRTVTDASHNAAAAQKQYADALQAANQLAKNLVALEEQYIRDREWTIQEYHKRRNRMEEDYQRSQRDILESFQRQRERMMRDFLRTQTEAETEYNKRRAELAERYGEEARRAEEEHQKRMARMREDYQIRQEEAVAARDAITFLRNAREYEINRRRAEEDAAEQRAERQRDYQRQLEDMQEAFAEQREARLAYFQQQQQDMQDDFNYRQARAAEYHALEMQRFDAEHRERLLEMEKQFNEEKEAERRAFRERLLEMEGFNKEFLALERQRNAEAKRLLEDTIMEMRRERAQATYRPVHGRQHGGYATYGVYTLGERGREYVLNAQATRAAERLLGGPLSQDSVLAMLAAGRSVINNFSQTVNIGAQDTYAGLLAAIRAETIRLLTEYARA